MRAIPKKPCSLVAALALAFQPMLAPPCFAQYPRVDLERVPIARLITNLEELVEKKPQDARLRLNLARVHAMAYSSKADTTEVRKGDLERGAWFGYEHKHVPFDDVKKTDDEDQLRIAKEHLAKAIKRYEEAIKLDPKSLTAQLGLAWCTEQSGNKRQAIEEYRKVVDAAWAVESQYKSGFGEGHFVMVEAADYLKRLLDPRSGRDRRELEQLEARSNYLLQLPRSVTPIIVPLAEDVSLEEMIDPQASVAFDADGTALPQRWSWITPQAGWLVYDQQGTGQITSALQMFGNVTFMLFWDSGYQALSSLDDDGDGRLAGPELEHLAIWRDRNGNGKSEKGEVQPLAYWGIAAIDCAGARGHDREDVAAYAPEGVRLSDGSWRPTYDLLLRRQPHAATLTRGASKAGSGWAWDHWMFVRNGR